jgi:hypothetical protein
MSSEVIRFRFRFDYSIRLASTDGGAGRGELQGTVEGCSRSSEVH